MRQIVGRRSHLRRQAEPLEDRLCLSTQTLLPSPAWFAMVDQSVGPEIVSAGPSDYSSQADAQRFIVRLTDLALSQISGPQGAVELLAGLSVPLTIERGLGLPGQLLVSSTDPDTDSIRQALLANFAIASVEAGFEVGASDATGQEFPNEHDVATSLFSTQYGLHNTGQSGGTADVDIDAPEAWKHTTGDLGTVIAIVDSGIDYTHRDLYLNVWLNPGEIPGTITGNTALLNSIDSDTDGTITFRDLNTQANRTREVGNRLLVLDLDGNGRIDAGDLLNDPFWADGIDTDENGFEDDLVGWDFEDNDNDPFDEHRHGTHVAGIIGAIGDNADRTDSSQKDFSPSDGFDGGVVGVNWETSLMALRFLDENNSGDVADAISAINYSTMMKLRPEQPVNIRVSNNSWGSSGQLSADLQDAVAGNLAADILFVAAAGNGDVLGNGIDNDQQPFYPASIDLPNVISVAAHGPDGRLARFSNFGDQSVDITAPGVGIVSTQPGDTFGSRNGTSMATPFVSGAAALVFSVRGSASAVEVKDAILTGADTSLTPTSQIIGNRRLNAHGAVSASTFAPVPRLASVYSVNSDNSSTDITTAALTRTDATWFEITVAYTDDTSVQTTSFDIRDIEVTRKDFPDLLLRPITAAITTATISTPSGPQTVNAALYRFAVPANTAFTSPPEVAGTAPFNATANGRYFIHVRDGEIRDSEGLFTSPRQIGSFEVEIATPNVFHVNTTLDLPDTTLANNTPADANGRISLRAAIQHANRTGVPSTIVIPAGIYTFNIPGSGEDASATGDLDITSRAAGGITLIGAGAYETIIDAQQFDRVFDIAAGATATLSGMTVRNGNAPNGGAIRTAGNLTVDSSLITTSTAELSGGGIRNPGGNLTIRDSSIENNTVTSRLFSSGGGGIAIVGAFSTTAGDTTITRSSIVNNTSPKGGGGLTSFDARLMLTDVTIAENVAQRSNGGGLSIANSSIGKTSTLDSVTITDNIAANGNGGGLFTSTSTAQVTVTNSIIAHNTARTSDDVEALLISNGNNIFGQPSENRAHWRTLAPSSADFDDIGTAQAPFDPHIEPLARPAVTPAGYAAVPRHRLPVAGGAASNDDLAGIAELALTPGLPIVYSTVELEPNNSRGEAMRLDDRGWSLDFDENIDNSTTIPHVTITGTGDGTFDYFSFTVSAPNTTAVFDIDNGSLLAAETFDTELFLFDSSNNLLAMNDDASLDTGSTSSTDSRIEYNFAAAGYYTVAVGAYNSSRDRGSRLTGTPPADGKRYVLNMSVIQHALARTAYSPVSVPDGLTPNAGALTSSGYMFSTIQPLPFMLQHDFAAGDRPFAVALGDVNADGLDDMVTTNIDSSNVSVLLGNGDGTFQAAQNVATGNFPSSVALGDVNGDGFDDIVTGNSYNVSVLRGNGDGTFQAPQYFSAGISPGSVDLGDVSGDGFEDIVAANFNSDNVSVLLGNGDGTFQSPQNFTTGDRPRSVVLGDVDGDGLDDVVAANVGASNVSVLRGNGDGTFRSAQNFAVAGSPYDVALGDVNGDGFSDVVTANDYSRNVSVLLGNGDGTFQSAQHFAAGAGARSVAIGDVNGDGLGDVVTANYGSGEVGVLQGNGVGTFQAVQHFPIMGRPTAVVLGDVNGDGLRDIVAAGGITDNVTVLLSSSGNLLNLTSPSPTLESIPLHERPLLFAEVDRIIYWLTASRNRMSLRGDAFTLWSYSVVDGVNKAASFDNISGAGLPVKLLTAGSTLVIVFESHVRLFDTANKQLDSGVFAGGTFLAAQNFATGSNPESVVLGDVNGDGLNDIVTVSFGSGDVSVLLGNGDGTFKAGEKFATGGSPESVALRDVSGDGLVDIVTANRSDTVSVLPGNGDGTFQEAQKFAARASVGPNSVMLGDVTGDGFDDIVTASFFDDSVSVLPGNGDGSFQTAQNFDVADEPYSVVLGDVNGDGLDDIVTANRNGSNVSVLRAIGGGEFQSAQDFAIGVRPYSVVLGDVNGDGLDDIVTRGSGSVSVLPGNGDGSFQSAQTRAAGVGPGSVVLIDVNRDGFADIVTGNSFGNNVNVLRGNGDGTFQLTENVSAGDGPRSVVLGDTNGDGLDDIVTANGNRVSVLRASPSFTGLLEFSDVTVVGSAATLHVQQVANAPFQPFLIEPVDSVLGPLDRLRDYEFLQLAEYNNKLLATVRLIDATERPGELQLLLIDAPQFRNGVVLRSKVDNLTLNSTVRLTAGDDHQLFVAGDRVFLTGDIVGSGIGEELLVFDRVTGLRLVSDLLPGPQSSQARDFVAAGDEVYFTALVPHVDNNTRQAVLRRELLVIDAQNQVRAVRAGQEATLAPSAVGDRVLFGSQVNAGDVTQLFQFDTAQSGVPSDGAGDQAAGSVTGTVFLDRNSNGQRDTDEPGRSGVVLFADFNNNGRRDIGEPRTVSRFDDPGTAVDETGDFRFDDLPAGQVSIREELASGLVQSAPLTFTTGIPHITELANGVTSGVGAPVDHATVVGNAVVRVDRSNGTERLLRENGDGTTDIIISAGGTLPGIIPTVTAIGSSHAQDGSSVAFVVTLSDSSQAVVLLDARDQIRVIAKTGTGLQVITEAGLPLPRILASIADAGNGGFPSLTITGDTVGFYATTMFDGLRRYYLGDGQQFVEFDHGAVLLDGGDEIFVDRVLQGSPEIHFTGDDLFVSKSELDARTGGSTGWQITTSTGITILPLTTFDRIYDVSVSGLKATFRALDVTGTEAVYLAEPGTETTRIPELLPGRVPSFALVPMTSFSTTLTIADPAAFFLNAPFAIRVGRELMRVTNIQRGPGLPTLQVIRGISGTTADSHFPGEFVFPVFDGYGSAAQSTTTSGVALDGDVSVFIGRSSGRIGLYARIDGQIRTLVDSESNFGGRTLTDLSIGPQAVSGGRVVYQATFAGGTQSLFQADLPSEPVATVTINPGETISGVLFGAAALPGTIQGVSFTDVNSNGVFDSGEPRNSGRTVYLDDNLNGVLDSTETRVLTNSGGEFVFADLEAERSYVVREVLPNGVVRTTAKNLNEATVRLGAAQTRDVVLGSAANTTSGVSADGVVTGNVFEDRNNNGRFDAGTGEGLSGVTVFVDENGDRLLNGGERSTVTGSDGFYSLGSLRGDLQAVRIVTPAGTSQVNPLGNSFNITPVAIAGDSPVDVVSGDFDNDGDNDLLTALRDENAVRLFINDGAGNLSTDTLSDDGITRFVVSGLGGAFDPGSLAVGHFRGANAAVGVVAGGRNRNEVVVLTPQADGRFSIQTILSAAASVAFGNAAYFVAAGDLNGDGFDDIAAVSQGPAPGSPKVLTFLSNGAGHFTQESLVSLDGVLGAAAIHIQDVTGDHRADLLIAANSGHVVVLKNTGQAGAGRFNRTGGNVMTLATNGQNTIDVQAGDLDGDGDVDLVAANFTSNNLSVFLSNGDGTFDAATPDRIFATGTGPAELQLVDLDLDGDLDVVNSDSRSQNRFTIVRNSRTRAGDGELKFQAPEAGGVAVFTDGSIAFSLVVAQLTDDNGDGQWDDQDVPDVVVATRGAVDQVQVDAGNRGGGLAIARNSIVAGSPVVDLSTQQDRTASGISFLLSDSTVTITLTGSENLVVRSEGGQLRVIRNDVVDSGFSSISTATIGTLNIVGGPGGNSIDLRNVSSGAFQPGLVVLVDAGDGDDDIRGSGFADRIIGGLGSDLIDGGDGNDELFGDGIGSALPGDGDDTIFGGAGNDTASGGGGSDVIAGQQDDDSLDGGDGDDQVRGGGGRDTVRGGNGADVVEGGDGADSLEGGSGNDTVSGDAGNDTLRGNEDDDTLTGGTGRDVLTGGGGSDLALETATGRESILLTNTELIVGGIADKHSQVERFSLIGGALASRIDARGYTLGPVTVSGGTGDDTLLGSPGDDSIDGGSGNDSIVAGNGNDSVDGGNGADVINGGDGLDTVRGGAGGDNILGGDGVDLLDGGSEDDTIVGGNGGDVILGGAGNDNVWADAGNDTVTGGDGNDTLRGGEDNDELLGGLGDDRLVGQLGNNRIDGGAGDDAVVGGTGNDTLIAGEGRDILNGRSGTSDVVVLPGLPGDERFVTKREFGQLRLTRSNTDFFVARPRNVEVIQLNLAGGNDTFIVQNLNSIIGLTRFDIDLGNGVNEFDASANKNVNFTFHVTGGSGDDLIRGGAGNDTLLGGGGNDRISGGSGDDSIEGNDGDDTVRGDGGRDIIFGGFGADLIAGGTGNDQIAGNNGRDTLLGDDGDDSLFGGADADILVGGVGGDRLDGEDTTNDTLVGQTAREGTFDDTPDLNDVFLDPAEVRNAFVLDPAILDRLNF